jgi:hypothetical protein|tara:strand:- start:163 stop:783 length:621 start_codon:yes stop_codon:yes gene_type:complete
MAITTYAELQTSIANWLNRDDLTTVIPDFISLTEAGINRSLRHYKMINRVDATLDSRYVQMPADWMETVRFSITSGNTYKIELISRDDMLEYRQNTADVSGRPRFYANIGDTIEVFPTPDADYQMQLQYYAKTPALSATNASNWLLASAPDIYLYGALVQAAPYLNDDARTQTWAALYASAMQSLQKASDDTRFAGSGLRMRVTSY